MYRKRNLSIYFILIILIFTITGCRSNPGQEEANSDLNIYTSIYPIYDFTSKIAGDKAQVENIMPIGGDAHGWEPSPTDIVKLEKADMFVYNGAGMEYWVDGVLNTIDNKDLIIVEASKGIDLIKDGNNQGLVDPHIWTDPSNVKKEMKNIREGLIELDPNNKEYYEKNYEKYRKELDKLDREFSETIKSLANKDIVVPHKSFTYMSKAYGLNQVPIAGISSDSEPNPDRMAEIIEFVEENQVRVIFYEELGSSKIAEAIADASGADLDVLNPLEGLSNKERENGDDYFSIMRKNLKALEKALK